MTWTPPSSVCVRQAWLTLGALSVQLENQPGGWFCSSLDLGYPEVRDVVTNRPDQDGVDDRTRYMGSRVVSADITALVGAGARIDAVASSFAPFMVPSARPVLHYILDRPGAAERTMTLRASGYSWPVVGANQRDIQLQWVCSDPVARDPNAQTVTAWAGSSTPPGRGYSLTFNRIYPPGSGASTTGQIRPLGDVPVLPLYRIYGPVTWPKVSGNIFSSGSVLIGSYQAAFLPSFTVGSGQWVDVDSAAKTANLNSDPTQSVLSQLDWNNTAWASVPPAPGFATLFLQGQSTSGVTQVQAIWHDGYLT